MDDSIIGDRRCWLHARFAGPTERAFDLAPFRPRPERAGVEPTGSDGGCAFDRPGKHLDPLCRSEPGEQTGRKLRPVRGPVGTCLERSVLTRGSRSQIAMDSVSTQIPLLTKHLKRADFLDVEHYPKATFVSSRVETSKDKDATHVLTGNLTIHGVTRTLSIPARFAVSGDLVTLDADVRGQPVGVRDGKGREEVRRRGLGHDVGSTRPPLTRQAS